MATMAIRDVSLFVRVVGRGHPIVLMHGGPGLDHTTLSSLESLSDSFQLIFYDHRANGRSTGAVTSMTWDNLTADADALRGALGFDEWAVLGQSFGGNVALEYVLRYPRRVSHLLLFDTCADAWWIRHHAAEILAKRGYRAGAVRAARRFYTGELKPDEVLPSVFPFVGAYYYRFGLSALANLTSSVFRLKTRPEAHVFGFRQLLAGWTVMHRLREITAPTLVLAGRHDFLFPPEHQALLAERISGARLEIIERAGHNAHEERAAEVTAIVRCFMDSASRRADRVAMERLSAV